MGDFVTIRNLRPTVLRELITRVRDTPFYAEKSRQSACELERIQGLSRAAEIVERAIVKRRRVLSLKLA